LHFIVQKEEKRNNVIKEERKSGRNGEEKIERQIGRKEMYIFHKKISLW
jgi:hypothetical protein